MPDKDQWYTNKDLFEQINSVQGDFRDLRTELTETRKVIKKYNGLREEIGEVKTRVESMESNKKGAQSVLEGIKSWGGWLFGLVTLVVLLTQI
ncbi:hypothetical protein ACM26V_00495 [Salipaludibacillus sp. HK11]|uniref:hypothetical protein n=1 Tax=Salipaludibacillus sp. HK11 TaxID=3394320 RepID=UPI0039FD2129